MLVAKTKKVLKIGILVQQYHTKFNCLQIFQYSDKYKQTS